MNGTLSEVESDGSLQRVRVSIGMDADVTSCPVRYANVHIWDFARSLSAGLYLGRSINSSVLQATDDMESLPEKFLD